MPFTKTQYMKKVLVLFEFPTATLSQYENVWKDLSAAGMEHPKGLISHVGCQKPEGSLMVVDVWESAEAFREFGNTLMPIIIKNGIPLTEPKILNAHYVYTPEPRKMMV
jgi:hypothetical protein